jgi:predicted nucleic acid-binding protein
METTRLVIDSDIIIDQFRGYTSILLSAIELFDCSLTAVGLYELWAAPVISAQQRIHLDDLLTTVNILQLDEPSALTAAGIMRQLSREGEVIGVPDILTAGICLHHDLPLLTRNTTHFNRVIGLKLITPNDLEARFDQQ